MSRRKKVVPESVPKVIEADDGEDFVACIPHQIKADWHEKWGALLEGFPLNIVYAGITDNAQASPTITTPSTEFEPEVEPEVEDYYPEDESCFVIIGGIHPPKNSTSRKKLPPLTSSRSKRASGVYYWPDLATFHDDSRQKRMSYFTKPKNGYSIRVIFEKQTGRWVTKKFRGRNLIQTAFGSTFRGAMLHTTMRGPEPDER